MPPRINLQPVLFSPNALEASLNLLWVRHAGHALVRLEVRGGKDGELLGLSVGPVPDLRDPEALKDELISILGDLVNSLVEEYLDKEPF